MGKRKLTQDTLGDTWVAQSVKCLTLAQVMISQFMGSSPTSGSVRQLRAWNLLQIWCLPLSLPLPCSCSVSLSHKNKLKYFKKILKDTFEKLFEIYTLRLKRKKNPLYKYWTQVSKLFGSDRNHLKLDCGGDGCTIEP